MERSLNDPNRLMRVTMTSALLRADWHLSVLLGLLLLVVFVLYPMSNQGVLLMIALQAFLSLILISGTLLVARRRVASAVAVVLAVGTGIIGWIRLLTAAPWLSVLGVSMWIVFLGMLAAVILIRAFHAGSINLHRIQGAVAAYLLIGVIWSGLYRIVFEFDPGAFNMPAGDGEGTLMSKLVYFSFATLTTVGYGDITAVAVAARSFAMLEALTGQLFPAIMLARLVSMEVIHRTREQALASGKQMRPGT
jgi:hypothetical protein